MCRFTLAQQLRCAAEGLNVTKQHETHGGNRLIGYEKLNHSNDGTDGEKAPPIKQKQFLGSLSHHPLLVSVMRSAELNPIAPTERVRRSMFDACLRLSTLRASRLSVFLS